MKESTVRTILKRLEEKGYVEHRVEGRTNVYSGIDAPQNVAAKAVRQIIERFCGGSVEQLLVGMVNNDVVDEQRVAAAGAAHRAAQGPGGQVRWTGVPAFSRFSRASPRARWSCSPSAPRAMPRVPRESQRPRGTPFGRSSREACCCWRRSSPALPPVPFHVLKAGRDRRRATSRRPGAPNVARRCTHGCSCAAAQLTTRRGRTAAVARVRARRADPSRAARLRLSLHAPAGARRDPDRRASTTSTLPAGSPCR